MDNINSLKNCEYCKKTFVIKSNKGSEQKFCCIKCKNDFHALGRKYLKYQLETGEKDIHTIKEQVSQYLKHKGLAI